MRDDVKHHIRKCEVMSTEVVIRLENDVLVYISSLPNKRINVSFSNINADQSIMVNPGSHQMGNFVSIDYSPSSED